MNEESSTAPTIDNDDDDESLSLLSSSSSQSSQGLSCSFDSVKGYFRSQWKLLLLGQVLSLLLASTGAAQATMALADCPALRAPAFSIGFLYVGLSFCMLFTPPSRRTRVSTNSEAAKGSLEELCDEDKTLEPASCYHSLPIAGSNMSKRGTRGFNPTMLYFFMAFANVSAQYSTFLAFRYTSITSVTLLDAFAIPSAMFLSHVCLGKKYSFRHLLGVSFCVVGIAFNFLQDYKEDVVSLQPSDDELGLDDDRLMGSVMPQPYNRHPYKLYGDLLALFGGLMLGANSVLTEIAVRNKDGGTAVVFEYLGMMGLFGTIMCTIIAVSTEREAIHTFLTGGTSSFQGFALVAWFTAASIMSYLGTAKFLQVSEATFLNLCLLTGDLWSVCFSILVEHVMPPPLFYGALVSIVAGVVIYETAHDPNATNIADKQLLHRDIGLDDLNWKDITDGDTALEFVCSDISV